MSPAVFMAEEISEAIQIIRVMYEGITVCMKVGSGGLNAIKKLAEFFAKMLEHEKALGKTNMKKLLMRGGDLQVLSFKTKDVKTFKKLAKKYGILYSTIPSKRKDGTMDILFHTEATPRINIMLSKLKGGKILPMGVYLGQGDKKFEFAGRNKKEQADKTSSKAEGHKSEEEISKEEELVKRVKRIKKSKDNNLKDITISKVLIVNENDEVVRTRIPGRFGENARYIEFKKSDLIEINDGKTFLGYIDITKEYVLKTKDGMEAETALGSDLSKHYSNVNSNVRNKYDDKSKTTTKKTTAKKKSTTTVRKVKR